MNGMQRGAIALLIGLVATTARADDPQDPAMRTAAARARDREQTRRLNLAEQARVRARDAGYAAGWNATRAAGGADRAAADHAAALDRYERDMAAWRRAVAACNAGDRDACR